MTITLHAAAPQPASRLGIEGGAQLREVGFDCVWGVHVSTEEGSGLVC